MFVVPKSEITIGSVRFYGEQAGVNAVTIKESVDSLETVPRSLYRATSNARTAKAFWTTYTQATK